MAITIRALGVDDLGAIDAVLRAAYGRDASFQPDLSRYLQLQPDGWLMAEAEGAAAGCVGAIDCGAFAYVGLMGVDPAQQRRGIALALMERLLAFVDARHCPAVLLDATPAGAPLYARLGFVDRDEALAFQCEAPAATPSASASPITVEPLTAAVLPALVAFDAARFGAQRTAVLAQYLREGPERAFIARDEAGAISGVLIAQGRLLGPWVAATPATAAALLDTALALPFSGPIGALTPAANDAAVRLLGEGGFRVQRSLRHMIRGPVPARQRTAIYGQASFALG